MPIPTIITIAIFFMVASPQEDVHLDRLFEAIELIVIAQASDVCICDSCGGSDIITNNCSGKTVLNCITCGCAIYCSFSEFEDVCASCHDRDSFFKCSRVHIVEQGQCSREHCVRFDNEDEDDGEEGNYDEDC